MRKKKALIKTRVVQGHAGQNRLWASEGLPSFCANTFFCLPTYVFFETAFAYSVRWTETRQTSSANLNQVSESLLQNVNAAEFWKLKTASRSRWECVTCAWQNDCYARQKSIFKRKYEGDSFCFALEYANSSKESPKYALDMRTL